MTEKHQKPGSAGAGPAPSRVASSSGSGADATPSAGVPVTAAGPEPFSAVELRQISTHIATQWFLPVEGNRLTLMEIDPWRVHAYWNVAEADLAAARTSLPDAGQGAALVLRFIDLSPRTADAAPPHPRFDIEVQQARNNWYIGLWRDAKHYSAELGLRAPDGTFVGLVRSNEVETPRSGPSPELDFHRLEVRPPRVLQFQRAASGTGPSEGLLRNLFPQRLPPDDAYPLAMAEVSRVVVEEPPFPALEAVRGEVEPWEAVGAAGAPTDAAAGATDDFPVIAAAEIDPYRAAARQAKARVLAELGSGLPPVAEETVSPADVDLQPQPLPVSILRAVDGLAMDVRTREDGGYSLGGSRAPDGGSPTWPPAVTPLEAVLAGAVSSPGPDASPLEVLVDLVIQGRHASAGPVTLCGNRVQVDDDGSFTVRLPLAPGPDLAELIRRLCSRYGEKDGG